MNGNTSLPLVSAWKSVSPHSLGKLIEWKRDLGGRLPRGDRTGQVRHQLETLIDGREVLITRFTQLELLQGSLDKKEWVLLSTYLETQDYVEPASHSWQAAARIYYDLRRQGLTIRSPIDCCIAQAALENNLLLIHNDRDFETIAQVRSLPDFCFSPQI